MRRIGALIILVVLTVGVALPAFATGRQDDTPVTICHKGNTITVDDDAVWFHILLHGDTIGACPNDTTTTTVAETTTTTVEETTTTSQADSTTTTVQEETTTTVSDSPSTTVIEETTTTVGEETTTTVVPPCGERPCGWPIDDPDFDPCVQLFADECQPPTTTVVTPLPTIDTVPDSDAPEKLPFTGIDERWYVIIATGLMVSGLVFVALSSRDEDVTE